MTGQQIVTFFESLIDDSPDVDYELDLANHVKDVLEGERDWEFLKKIDSSKSWSSGDTYLTAKALPTDFVEPVVLYAGTEYQPYLPTPFEQRQLYKDSSRRYYIDYAGKNLHMCGSTPETKTLYLCYIYQTDDLTLLTSPVWPAKFHKLIAFYMAGVHLGAVDSDDIARLLAPNNKVEYLMLRKNMVDFDARIKAHSMNYQSGESINFNNAPNVVDL